MTGEPFPREGPISAAEFEATIRAGSAGIGGLLDLGAIAIVPCGCTWPRCEGWRLHWRIERLLGAEAPAGPRGAEGGAAAGAARELARVRRAKGIR
jgi:hypothetical protein